jgi:hypothetical protein
MTEKTLRVIISDRHFFVINTSDSTKNALFLYRRKLIICYDVCLAA